MIRGTICIWKKKESIYITMATSILHVIPQVHYTGGSDQDHPQEKEMQKGKMVV